MTFTTRPNWHLRYHWMMCHVISWPLCHGCVCKTRTSRHPYCIPVGTFALRWPGSHRWCCLELRSEGGTIPQSAKKFVGNLSKWGRQRQRQEARKIFLRNPRVLLSTSLLWLPCMFLFSLKFRWLQRLLNETMDVSSWNVGHVLKTAWKWAVEVSFESRTARMSALFHIFTYAFCLV